MHNDQKPVILFDLVSTITDAGPRYAEAYARVAERYSLLVPDRGDVLNDLGDKNLRQIIAAHSPDLPQGLVGHFMDDCNNACDALLYDVHWIERVFDGVRGALETLRGQGYVLGLYTGTREDAMQAQLRYHNLLGLFDPALVRGKDNARDAAKNTEVLKAEQLSSLIASYRARPGHEQAGAIVVGDTLSDYNAARVQGAAFIGFAGVPQKVQDFTDAGVMAVFDHYDRLPGLVDLMPDQAGRNPAGTSPQARVIFPLKRAGLN